MRLLTEDLSEAERKILIDVDEHGVHIVHVPGDDGGAEYSFSIGLWHSFAHPEVVVFGLPADVARELIDVIATEVSHERKFDAGVEADDLIEGYRAQFLAVPHACHERFFGLARWAYEGDEFRVVQLVYPDQRGMMPWAAGVSEGFLMAQPVIGERDLGGS